MDLKSFLSGDKNPLKELFWSLIIEPEWVSAGIWYINEDTSQALSVSSPVAWKTDEELVTACDTVLSNAVQKLPEDASEPTKTVFGVPSSWVSQGEINPDYIEKIKVVSEKLALVPVGFVVMDEAISHYIKSQEGAPVTAVIVGVGNDTLEVSLYRIGNQLGTTLVGRSISVTDDIAEGLARYMSSEPLPSRILLYNGKGGELEDIKQEILSKDWTSYENVKFLHTPKIEIITPEEKVLSVCLAGGLEMAKVNKVQFEQQEVTEPEMQEVDTDISLDAQNVEEVKNDDLGFYEGDVLDLVQKKEAPTLPEPQYAIPQTPPQFNTPHPTPLSVNSKGKENKIISNLSSIPTLMGGIFHKLPSFRGRGFKTGKIPVVIPITSFMVIFIFLFFLWWNVPKVLVKIYVSPQNLDDSLMVNVDPKATSSNISGSILAGEEISKEISITKESDVTGVRVVGDKAKGEVKMFRSGPAVTLSAGTEVVGSNLIFTLDEKAEIASGSAGTPGVIVVAVTAGKIGSDYNLAGNTSFKISNYPTSELEGKNENAFSGGSSREVSAVSEDDREKLLKSATEELSNEIIEGLKSQVGEDKMIIEESLTTEVVDKVYSGKTGDEASNLSLKLTLKGRVLVVSKSDLGEMVKETIKNKVAEGLSLRDDQIKLGFEKGEEKDGVYQIKVLVKANLLPRINLDDIKSKIAGRYPEVAKKYLADEVNGFTKVELTFSLPLPGKLAIIPHVKKNIEIEIQSSK